MATNEQTMAWMMDTYSVQRGYAVPEIVTGKPISIGGSVFRHEATGAGAVMVFGRACERLGWKLAEQRCVVRRASARSAGSPRGADERGRRCSPSPDISGGSYDPAGLTSRRLATYAKDGPRLARGLGRGARTTN